MSDIQQALSTMENDFTEIAGLVNEVAYEKFSNGELTAEQLAELYGALRRWAAEMEAAIMVLKTGNRNIVGNK